jgi:preprotein translocase subunit SecE
MENKELEVVETKEPVRQEVKEKLEKQIAKKHAKMEGKSRILEYLMEEHKWENYVFLAVSVITLVLGTLILVGTLTVKDNMPLIGDYPKVFAWVLVGIAGVGVLYALYPFFKPSFPEFKKITWIKGWKFVGNIIRTFLFIIIFALLFLLYDAFIQQLLEKILG